MKKLGQKLSQIKRCIGKDILITLGMRKGNRIDILNVKSAEYIDGEGMPQMPDAEYIG